MSLGAEGGVYVKYRQLLPLLKHAAQHACALMPAPSPAGTDCAEPGMPVSPKRMAEGLRPNVAAAWQAEDVSVVVHSRVMIGCVMVELMVDVV